MNSLVIVVLLCGNLKIALSEIHLSEDAVNNVARFLYPQPRNLNTRTETKEDYVQIPLKISIAVDRENKIQEYKNTITDLFDQCKYLVGRSKIPFCRLNPLTEKPDTSSNYPRSCREILESGNNKSGVYKIKPRTNSKPFTVLCDMETSGGGWTHIQKRIDGSQDFFLPWRDYKFGFGDLSGEFWIGLENIYRMTAFETNELLVELTKTNKKKIFGSYEAFSIGSEIDGYILNKLEGYSGSIGDSLTYHLNAKFTTLDLDQDSKDDGNCAKLYEAAWWYSNCYHSNLNGKFMTVGVPELYTSQGLVWKDSEGNSYILAGSRMLIRPIGE